MKRLVVFLSAWLALAAGAQPSTLFTVEQHGPRSQRINLVFLSEGYTAAGMPAFATHVNQAVNFLFSKEPWQQYRSYCNVYRIEIASNQSGCDYGAAGEIRDTVFGSGFGFPTVPQLLTLGGEGAGLAYSLLNAHVPEYDIAVVLVNDGKYGGSGGPIAVASAHSLSAAIVEHELGHSFALLADEYDVDYLIYTPSEQPNNTAETDRQSIRWNHWIDEQTPLPTAETLAFENTVGLFEGSMYRTSGWYRPHYNSLMRSLNRPCGAVNREQFVLQYYARISPVDGATPAPGSRAIDGYERLDFTVAPKTPGGGGALLTGWEIDGLLQPGAGGNAFSTTTENLGNGLHTVTAAVHDPTPFVRLDPYGLLGDSVSWQFTLTQQLPPDLPAWLAAYGSPTADPAHDGLQILVKYVLGLDPALVATPAQRPAASTTSGHLTLTVPRRNKRADADAIVEVSSDLATWHSGPGDTVTLQDTETRLVVRDATPVSAGGRRFIRLRVQER